MARERITISVQRSLVARIDALIDKQDIRNRSHAIESILTKSLAEHHVTEAVVCIGGPHTKAIVSNLKQLYPKFLLAGIGTVWFVLGEQSIAQQPLIEPELPPNLQCHFHATRRGSGGGIKEILPHLQKRFLIVNTDKIHLLNLPLLESYHRRFSPLVTLQQTASSQLLGFALCETGIGSFVESGFTLLEENVLPKMIASHQAICFPTIV